MIYVGKLDDGRAVIYYAEKYAMESGGPYAPFEESDIPEGEGLLMTDLERLWWEPVPEPAPEPEPEPSAEDAVWAEMAAAIREGVNAV